MSNPALFDVYDPTLGHNFREILRVLNEIVVVLAGVPGGQIVYGGVDTGDYLKLHSNQLLDGKIFFGDNSAYNESNGRLGIGTTSPSAVVHAYSSAAADTDVLLQNTNGTAQYVAYRMKNALREWRFRNTNGGSFQLVDVQGGKVVWGADIGALAYGLYIQSAGTSFFGSGSYGGGQGVLFISNRTTAPTSNPTGGVILYAEGGALKCRGSSGTITTIAPA